MGNKKIRRSTFIKNIALTGAAIGLSSHTSSLKTGKGHQDKKQIGIIGLDTSHCISLTKLLNAENPSSDFDGYKVVAAYPHGSYDIRESVERIPEYTDKIKQYGVEIVDSIEDLLRKADAILLLTNDGRLHLKQVIPVFKSGKPVYIDKPVAASLKDTIEIFRLSKHYNVPAFSSSALRFIPNLQEVADGKFGKVFGAETYSPAALEKTHPDLTWYAIHGVEILYTAMGTGCQEVVRVHTDSTDFVVGTWRDDRIGAIRGTRTGKHIYGGTIHTESGAITIDAFAGYGNLTKAIINFFKTGIAPVDPKQTIEMMAFMEAADKSKDSGGVPVKLEVTY